MTLREAASASAAVALGAACGALLRFWIGYAAQRAWGDRFPWGTLIVNLAGSLAIGAAAALLSQRSPALPLVAAGLLGGFTTFSAFSLETMRMIQDGRWGAALTYAALSLGGGAGLAALGWTAARRFAS